MTTTRIYKSTDTSAPALSGTTGSLVALLHACLVGTAGVAYGSGGTAKTAAGWSEPFTNTSTKGVFRNSVAAGGTGVYLRVLDDGSGAGVAREGFQVAYATMSDIDTGTHPTPTVAQMATGTVVRKSSTADSSVRAWIMVADELTFYLWIESLSSQEYENSIYGAGDYVSDSPGDSYRFFSMGRNGVNVAGGACGFMTRNLTVGFATPITNSLGLWLGSGYDLAGGAIAASFASFIASTTTGAVGASGSGMLADPSPGPGLRYYIPAILVCQATIRGRLRGCYAPLNDVSAIAAGTIDSNAAGTPTGSALVLLRASALATGTSNNGRLGVESALAW
jgi:hypothetical protein